MTAIILFVLEWCILHTLAVVPCRHSTNTGFEFFFVCFQNLENPRPRKQKGDERQTGFRPLRVPSPFSPSVSAISGGVLFWTACVYSPDICTAEREPMYKFFFFLNFLLSSLYDPVAIRLMKKESGNTPYRTDWDCWIYLHSTEF